MSNLMEALDKISRIEILITDLIIFLIPIIGLIIFIRSIITAAKNPNRKQKNKYYTQDNISSYIDTGNYHSDNYDSSSSCDSGSFDGGGDCGGAD
ncbi:MAG: hypothetical protein AAGG00_18340 [Cyanobacteria bacterium P01_H01_bin.150]